MHNRGENIGVFEVLLARRRFFLSQGLDYRRTILFGYLGAFSYRGVLLSPSFSYFFFFFPLFVVATIDGYGNGYSRLVITARARRAFSSRRRADVAEI